MPRDEIFAAWSPLPKNDSTPLQVKSWSKLCIPTLQPWIICARMRHLKNLNEPKCCFALNYPPTPSTFPERITMAVWNSWFAKKFYSCVSWSMFSLAFSLTNNLLTGFRIHYWNSHCGIYFEGLRPIPNGGKMQFWPPIFFIRFVWSHISTNREELWFSKKL